MVLRESPAAPRTQQNTTARPRRPASHDPRGGRVGGSVSVTPASAGARCLPTDQVFDARVWLLRPCYSCDHVLAPC